ncbi:MAG: oligosaccharide flippase family protein, partial [Allobaculum sp.]|nr:oligosaccharide flippase family protein [Allobaculum sp.]
IGIPLYAVKEVAKYRDDRIQRDKTTIEIVCLSTILCLLGYICVWILAKYVPQIHQQASLFYILSLSIIFTGIGVNWFYQGIEDFKYITIRAIIIRTLSAVALFIFVKDSSDLLIYGYILVGSTVGNNFINFIHLRKHISFQSLNLKNLRIYRHLKPALHIFILNLIISLYVQLNSVMLGFLSNEEAVGYFTAGTKISHIGLAVIGSIATVMLPRCSHLLKIGKVIEFNSMINKSLNLTLALAIPMTIGLMILATPITIIFCGNEYYDAIPVLLLNAPVVIFISLTNLMGIQILYPKDKINIVIWSVSGGAVINIILNYILIPPYEATGAAISTLIAEFTVLLIQIFYGRKYFPFKIVKILNPTYIVGSLIMGIVTFCSIIGINTLITKLLVGVSVGIIVYSTYLIFIKDPLMKEAKCFIINVIGHARN